MSFAKPPDSKFNNEDDYQRLMCSWSGCSRVWTVMIDRPMCSFHQWGVNPTKDYWKKSGVHNDSQ